MSSSWGASWAGDEEKGRNEGAEAMLFVLVREIGSDLRAYTSTKPDVCMKQMCAETRERDMEKGSSPLLTLSQSLNPSLAQGYYYWSYLTLASCHLDAGK